MTIVNEPSVTQNELSCNSEYLPTIGDQNTQEAKCIATLAILKRDYFAQETPTFTCLRPDGPQTVGWDSVSEDLKACQIAISLDGNSTASALVKSIHRDFISYSNRYSVRNGDNTAILILESDDITVEASHEDILRVMELVKVDILAVAWVAPKGVSLDLWSRASKANEFRPFVISKSFSQVYKQLSSEPCIKVRDISSVSLFDVERIRQFTRPSPLKPAETPQCLHVLIGKNFSKRPNSMAMCSTKEQLTYSDLGRKSAIMAEALNRQGVAPGDVVGFCMEKSLSALVSLLGILRAGAAYAPMDSAYPTGRIAQVVEKADIRFVITEEKLCEKFDDIDVKTIVPDQLEALNQPHDWWEDLHTKVSTPAYVMFTSGSTGVPKGVVHHHGAVSQSLLECIDEFGINEKTRFFQFASLAFDASILEVFAPLVAGGCLCVPSQNERSGDLQSTMNHLRVTDAWLTPSIVPHLQPEALPCLRNLAVGGEPPSVEIISTWGKKVNFSNFYGTTEAGVWDTFKPGMKPDDNPRNIGRGIGRVSCWIVDPDNINNLRPVGAEGELLVQSSYLAHSYLKDEKRQKEALLDPTSLQWASLIHDAESTRIYRTGDLAKFTPKGDVIFIGRKTGFVKIRGLRVDLMEVEKTINATLENGRAAVVLSGTGNDHLEIAAFLEIDPQESRAMTDGIHNRISAILPEYMLPSILIPIERLPLPMSKKIDRHRLHVHVSKMDHSTLQKFRKGGSQSTTLTDIPPARQISISISNFIADIFKMKDKDFSQSLRGKDFSLSSVGLNSMHIVSLTSFLKKNYQKAIDFQTLRHPKMTVCEIEDIILEQSTALHKETQSRDLMNELTKLKSRLSLRKKTVFLTSITGFLGSQILRSLLENPEVGHIIGLVRSSDEESARRKVQQQAELGKWWRSTFHKTIEIWLGDLSKPRLGLNEDHWQQLFSNDDNAGIDGIIHNGARVNWMDSYEELEAVNVLCTADIVSGMSNMADPCQLVYVSGGYLSPNQESHADIAERLTSASGYDQTKFLSELLIHEYNQHLDRQGSSAPRGRTVIPGFIVGTRKEGIAHTEDFFWRLMFSIARVQSVSEDLGHLTVAGVDQVSELILNALLSPDSHPANPLTCLDGLSTSKICEIMERTLDIPIERVPHDQWIQILRDDVDQAEFDHPFSPMIKWFEDNAWQFFEGDPYRLENKKVEPLFDKHEIASAFQRSLEYLVETGYITTERSCPNDGMKKIARFTRSS